MTTHNLQVDDLILPTELRIQDENWDEPRYVYDSLEDASKVKFILYNYKFEVDNKYTLPILAEKLVNQNTKVYVYLDNKLAEVVLEKDGDTRYYICKDIKFNEW